MSDLVVLKKFPVILTKDPNWRPMTTVKEGAIILLPEDAVLLEVEEVEEKNEDI